MLFAVGSVVNAQPPCTPGAVLGCGGSGERHTMSKNSFASKVPVLYAFLALLELRSIGLLGVLWNIVLRGANRNKVGGED